LLESAGAAIDYGTVEALGEVQDAGQRVFSHRQCAADACRTIAAALGNHPSARYHSASTEQAAVPRGAAA